MSDYIDLFSEKGVKNGSYNKFYGTVKTADGVLYSRKEVKVLIDQDKRTGSPLTMNQHLVKKVFGGEIVEYKPKRKTVSSKNQIRENNKKSWDQISSPELF